MIIMFLASCENEAEKSQDEKTAESIWQEIDGYESWPQVSEWSGVMASIDGTHGSFVQIWINDVAMPSFQDSISSELPFASLLVNKAFQKKGDVADCSIVLESCNEYREGQDYLAEFIKDKVVKKFDSKIKKTEILEEFKKWYTLNYGRGVPKAREVYDCMNKKFGKFKNG